LPDFNEDDLTTWEHRAREAAYALGRKEWAAAIARLEQAHTAAQMAGSLELAWASLVMLTTILEVCGSPVESAQRNAQAQELRARLLADELGRAG
jgi:hypothetical protein